MMCATAVRILKEHVSSLEAVIAVCDRLGYAQNKEGRQEAIYFLQSSLILLKGINVITTLYVYVFVSAKRSKYERSEFC